MVPMGLSRRRYCGWSGRPPRRFGLVRVVLLLIHRAALLVAIGSLAYLLFVFGHSELAAPGRVLIVAALAGCSALTAGLLQWVGLPAITKESKGPARHRRRGSR